MDQPCGAKCQVSSRSYLVDGLLVHFDFFSCTMTKYEISIADEEKLGLSVAVIISGVVYLAYSLCLRGPTLSAVRKLCNADHLQQSRKARPCSPVMSFVNTMWPLVPWNIFDRNGSFDAPIVVALGSSLLRIVNGKFSTRQPSGSSVRRELQ